MTAPILEPPSWALDAAAAVIRRAFTPMSLDAWRVAQREIAAALAERDGAWVFAKIREVFPETLAASTVEGALAMLQAEVARLRAALELATRLRHPNPETYLAPRPERPDGE